MSGIPKVIVSNHLTDRFQLGPNRAIASRSVYRHLKYRQ